jgi:hypothetical protein
MSQVDDLTESPLLNSPRYVYGVRRSDRSALTAYWPIAVRHVYPSATRSVVEGVRKHRMYTVDRVMSSSYTVLDDEPGADSGVVQCQSAVAQVA